MVVLTNLLIFLFLFITETVEAVHPPRMYITGVTGNITCKYGEGKSALIVITNKKSKFYKTRVISQIKVRYGTIFFLVGSVRSFIVPNFKLKIYHYCVPTKYLSMQKYSKTIPIEYVFKVGRTVRFGNLGNLELSRLHEQKILFVKKR